MVVNGDVVPVLWLCGPPGVGKTTVAWEIYSQIVQAGIEAGYVDIDQLGMCYPEPSHDPGQHRMKAENLGAVVSNFRVAGARCVIVSGVLDPCRGVDAAKIPQAALTVCRLRAGRQELRERFVGRQGDADGLAEVLREADAWESSDVPMICVETSGLPVSEVARLVRERVGPWPPLNSGQGPEVEPARSAPGAATGAAGVVLWLCGATGVGKSAVGFEVYQHALRAGITSAYIDLDQLGFLRPAGDPDNDLVKARNLAALWHTYRTAGAECLVISGPARNEESVTAYTAALPAATVTVCRLHARKGQLTDRIMLRGEGFGWAQPGDPLKGRSTAHLRRVAEAATCHADALEQAAIGDLSIDTTDHTVKEAAGMVISRTGWPPEVPVSRSRTS